MEKPPPTQPALTRRVADPNSPAQFHIEKIPQTLKGAAIYHRKDGRWEGRYTAGHDPATGKAITKNVLGKTQAEVKEKLKAAMEKNVHLDVVRSGKYTVAEWVRLWFDTYSKPAIREQTAYYYNNYIEKHIVPGIGDIKLDKLTTLQIQRFYLVRLLHFFKVARFAGQLHYLVRYAVHKVAGGVHTHHAPLFHHQDLVGYAGDFLLGTGFL